MYYLLDTLISSLIKLNLFYYFLENIIRIFSILPKSAANQH